MNPQTSIDDAFYCRLNKRAKTAWLLFWSEQWNSVQPWIYEGDKIPYVCLRKYHTDLDSATFVFIGPLAVVRYKQKPLTSTG